MLETLFSCEDYQIRFFVKYMHISICSHEIHTRKILLLNSCSLIPSWWANVLQKEQVFRNPPKKAVLLVHNTFFSDPGFSFGKLKTDFDNFCSNFIDQPNTARTGHVETSDFLPLFSTHWVFHLCRSKIHKTGQPLVLFKEVRFQTRPADQCQKFERVFQIE